jgi:hypothetical protein
MSFLQIILGKNIKIQNELNIKNLDNTEIFLKTIRNWLYNEYNTITKSMNDDSIAKANLYKSLLIIYINALLPSINNLKTIKLQYDKKNLYETLFKIYKDAIKVNIEKYNDLINTTQLTSSNLPITKPASSKPPITASSKSSTSNISSSKSSTSNISSSKPSTSNLSTSSIENALENIRDDAIIKTYFDNNITIRELNEQIKQIKQIPTSRRITEGEKTINNYKLILLEQKKKNIENTQNIKEKYNNSLNNNFNYNYNYTYKDLFNCISQENLVTKIKSIQDKIIKKNNNDHIQFDFNQFKNIEFFNAPNILKLISIMMNPWYFCNMWYININIQNKYNNEMVEIFDFINKIIYILFTKIFKLPFINYISPFNISRNDNIKRDTNIFKALCIQNLKCFEEHNNDNDNDKSILKNIIEDKIKEINKSGDTYIFNYKLINYIDEYYNNTKRVFINNFQYIYNKNNTEFIFYLEYKYYDDLLKIFKTNVTDILTDLNSNQPFIHAEYMRSIEKYSNILTYVKERNDGETLFGITGINPRYTIKLYEDNILNLQNINNKALGGSLQSKPNGGEEDDEEEEEGEDEEEGGDQKEKEGDEEGEEGEENEVEEEEDDLEDELPDDFNFLDDDDEIVETDNDDINILGNVTSVDTFKPVSSLPDMIKLQYYDFQINYFNYPLKIGDYIWDETNKKCKNVLGKKTKTELSYKDYQTNAKSVVTGNSYLNEKYFMGKINRYYGGNITATDIANDPECGNVILKKLQSFENIIIIGNGQSGSGKTSTLISLHIDATTTTPAKPAKDIPGVVPCIANKLPNLKLDGTDKKFTFATLKLINIYVKLSDKLTYIEDMNKDYYYISNIKLNNTVSPSITNTEYKFEFKNEWECIDTINTGETMDAIIAKAFDIREVEPTKNNPNSSRSHIIACITFNTHTHNISTNSDNKQAKIVICDLAGVEDKFPCEYQDLKILDTNYVDKSTKYQIKTLQEKNKEYDDNITNIKYDNYFEDNTKYTNFITDGNLKQLIKAKEDDVIFANKILEFIQKYTPTQSNTNNDIDIELKKKYLYNNYDYEMYLKDFHNNIILEIFKTNFNDNITLNELNKKARDMYNANKPKFNNKSIQLLSNKETFIKDYININNNIDKINEFMYNGNIYYKLDDNNYDITDILSIKKQLYDDIINKIYIDLTKYNNIVINTPDLYTIENIQSQMSSLIENIKNNSLYIQQYDKEFKNNENIIPQLKEKYNNIIENELIEKITKYIKYQETELTARNNDILNEDNLLINNIIAELTNFIPTATTFIATITNDILNYLSEIKKTKLDTTQKYTLCIPRLIIKKNKINSKVVNKIVKPNGDDRKLTFVELQIRTPKLIVNVNTTETIDVDNDIVHANFKDQEHKFIAESKCNNYIFNANDKIMTYRDYLLEQWTIKENYRIITEQITKLLLTINIEIQTINNQINDINAKIKSIRTKIDNQEYEIPKQESFDTTTLIFKNLNNKILNIEIIKELKFINTIEPSNNFTNIVNKINIIKQNLEETKNKNDLKCEENKNEKKKLENSIKKWKKNNNIFADSKNNINSTTNKIEYFNKLYELLEQFKNIKFLKNFTSDFQIIKNKIDLDVKTYTTNKTTIKDKINKCINNLQPNYTALINKFYVIINDEILVSIIKKHKKSVDNFFSDYYTHDNITKNIEDISKQLREFIRLSQLEYNCKIRRMEGYMINTSLLEMQKFIGKVLFTSAKTRFTDVLFKNNLLPMSDKLYDYNNIIKYLKCFIEKLNNFCKEIKQIKAKDYKLIKTFTQDCDELKKTLTPLKNSILKFFKFMSTIVKDKDNEEQNYYNIISILINICFVDFIMILFCGESKINFIVIIGIIKNLINKLYYEDFNTIFKSNDNTFSSESHAFTFLNTINNIPEPTNDYIIGIKNYYTNRDKKCDNIVELLNFYLKANTNTQVQQRGKQPETYAEKDAENDTEKDSKKPTKISKAAKNTTKKNTKTSEITAKKDDKISDNKINEQSNTVDPLCTVNSDFYTLISDISTFTKINDIKKRLDTIIIYIDIVKTYNDSLCNFYNKDIEDYKSQQNRTSDIPTPLLYSPPSTDVCINNKNKFKKDYDNFYDTSPEASNLKTIPGSEIIFNIIVQKKLSINDKEIEGFNIEMNNATIIIFTVINVTPNPKIHTNNPPTPPYININKLKILYELIKNKTSRDFINITKKSTEKVINKKTVINNFGKIFYEYIMLFDFYKTYANDPKLFYLQNNLYEQIKNEDFHTTIRDTINFIDSINATTLLGTVDFDRFTKIRKPENVYLVCDDNDENINDTIDIDKEYINKLILSLYYYNIKYKNNSNSIKTIALSCSDKNYYK